MIVVDDTRPTTYQSSLADRDDFFAVRSYLQSEDQQWMGDVYKLVFFVETFFPSLSYQTITNNHGQTLFWRARREAVPRASVREVDDLTFETMVRQQGRRCDPPGSRWPSSGLRADFGL